MGQPSCGPICQGRDTVRMVLVVLVVAVAVELHLPHLHIRPSLMETTHFHHRLLFAYLDSSLLPAL